jgi:hypothetical protein
MGGLVNIFQMDEGKSREPSYRGAGGGRWSLGGAPRRWWFDLCPFLSLGLRYSPLSVVCFSRLIPLLFDRAARIVDVPLAFILAW